VTEISGPEPGTEINLGEPAFPRPASTVIVMRGGSETLEVLLVQRSHEARFMGGVWVFPGGAVDADEGAGEDALRAAAVREVQEEATIDLGDPANLIPFSRWITPAVVSIRFDTWFFLAHLPEGAEAVVDGSECIDHTWLTPQAALDAHRAGELELVFPTIKHFEQIGVFESANALADHAAALTVEPVEPRISMEGEIARVLLPGEPGYDEA
jgi:8-oxo-dGTP pyrophosphatase MutT (NUDIX family)